MTREALQEIQTLVEENKGRWDELPASIQASAAELEKHQQALANSASTVDELNRLYEEQFITLEQYQEAVDEVMENEFEMEGLDPDAAEEVADAFRDMAEAGVEGMEALKNDEEAVKDATVRYMELNEAIEDIYDNYKDYTQVLKDVRNATSKADRAMAANSDSAKKLKVSMAGLLGTTEDMIDADFLATIDPKDFEAAANGNADAIERIRNQFVQLKAEMYGIDFASLKSELDAFNDGAYIDLNTTPFLNALIQAAVNAG
jgi:chromosome segregation ATPase